MQLMDYVRKINDLLSPKSDLGFSVIDLFAGCGGLALGFEAQGFRTLGYEMVEDYARTYEHNLAGECIVEKLHRGSGFPAADLVIGGPPCQPFSVGGYQKGLEDTRDGFPIFIEAIEQIKPKLFLFENVRGLMFRNKWYFDIILAKLKTLGYDVEFKLLNAKNYGVPQNRERLFVVGHKMGFSWPKPLNYLVTAGEALGELATLVPPGAKFLTPSMDKYVEKYEKASFCVRPRDLNLSKPARTLTCRNLAGATGDMQRLKLPDGTRRRLLVKEAARLQSFPDWFQFFGTETNQFNMIGNAVPPLLSYYVAGSVIECLQNPQSPKINRSDRLESQVQMKLFSEKKMKPSQAHCNANILKGKLARQTFRQKSEDLQRLINQALHILCLLGIPMDHTPRRLERIALVFLAIADVKKCGNWKTAKDADDGRSMTTRQIISYMRQSFSETISHGSYDDIRRQDLLMPVNAGLIIQTNPDSNRNNPGRGYALNPEFSTIVRSYNEDGWISRVDEFMSRRRSLSEELSQPRQTQRIPVRMHSGEEITLGPGEHNELQKKIIEDFLPRFGFGAEVLYVGDAEKRLKYVNKERLDKLNFFTIGNGELPDVVAYSTPKNWLYCIEAVHSANPITPLRLRNFRKLLAGCSAEIIYVSAFMNRASFRKFVTEIAWETEVWIAESPDHLIHFDGEQFLGPYSCADNEILKSICNGE